MLIEYIVVSFLGLVEPIAFVREYEPIYDQRWINLHRISANIKNRTINNYDANCKKYILKEEEVLYTLEIKSNKSNKKYVTSITPPKGSDFELLDRAFPLQILASKDFNADKKEDVMLNLGACGTGGCEYAIFLKQHANQYRLVYLDYLRLPRLKKTKKGQWIIESFEDYTIDAPYEYKVEVYKFNKTKYIYERDSTYMKKRK